MVGNFGGINFGSIASSDGVQVCCIGRHRFPIRQLFKVWTVGTVFGLKSGQSTISCKIMKEKVLKIKLA